MRLERALRAIAFAALAALVWLVFRSSAPSGRVVLRGAAVAAELDAWTAAAQAESLHVALETPLAPAARDWLLALRRAGTAVTWSGALAPLAATAEWSAGPAPLLHVRAAGAPSASLRLVDSLGELASATVASGGASFILPASGSGAAVRSGTTTARVAPAAAPMVRAVVVLGTAGWEPKFVVAALEERGWPVETRLRLAPRLSVTQGRPWPLDTARHSAVVVMDSLSPAEAAGVAAYARRGGGVVIVADAAAAALRGIAPAAISGRQRAASLTMRDDAPREALSFSRLTPDARAVVLERRGTAVAAAARRVGAGRVVQLGYDDTWRWRFAAADGAPEAHAAYWNAIVSAAAYRPADSAATIVEPGDPAPLASTVLALGPSRELVASRIQARGPFAAIAFAVLLAALLLEWTSRRIRGSA